MSVWRGNPPPERRTKAVAEERSIFLGQHPQFRILCLRSASFRKVRTVQKYKILQRCKRLTCNETRTSLLSTLTGTAKTARDLSLSPYRVPK